MRTLVNLRFEKGDPVCEYWLARGAGFVVETRKGRVVGEVVDSVFDPERQRVVGLVVREKVLGAVPGPTSELPADRIAAAVPGREAFVLDGAGEAPPEEPRQQRVAPAVRGTLTAAGGGIGSAATTGARGARTFGSWLAELVRRTVPVVRAVGAAAGAWAVGFAAWLVAAAKALAAEARRETAQASRELRRRYASRE